MTNHLVLFLPGIIVVKIVCLDSDMCLLAVLTVLLVVLLSNLEDLLVAEGGIVLVLAFLSRVLHLPLGYLQHVLHAVHACRRPVNIRASLPFV